MGEKNSSELMTDSVIHWRVHEWFPDLGGSCLEKLKQFHSELIKFNEKLNLVSAKSLFQADNVHFADCILACKMIQSQSMPTQIFDLGSGNGFPGLVIAIMNPSVKVIAVDSDQRKGEFLKHVGAALSLKNFEVKTQTIESLGAGSLDCAISRGLAGLTKSLLMTRKLFKNGGVFYHMKSEEWASEVVDLPTQLCTVWQPDHLGDYRLPVGEITYSVVKTIKIAD